MFADFAGEKDDAKSTSGGFLVLQGPKTFFPLTWVSKRQTSVSRRTTESKIVSLAHSLFLEALPALQLLSDDPRLSNSVSHPRGQPGYDLSC